MKLRIGTVLSALGCVCVAAAQTSAPPPKAQDVPVPPRPTTPPGPTNSLLAGTTLSAADAVRIALATQPTLEDVRQAVIAAQGRTQQLRSRLMPQLGVSGTYSTARFIGTEPIVNGSPRLDLLLGNGYGTTVTLTQLVFDAGHSSDLVKQSAALKDVAVQDLERAKQDLALQVLDGYYVVGEARRLVAVNEDNVKNRASQLELAQARFRSGIGGPDDVLTAQTAKGDAVVSLVQARTMEDQARVSLLQTLGLDPQTPVQVGDDGAQPITVDAFDAFVSTALTKRPEIRRAKANIDAARYGARAAKTTSAPVLAGDVFFGTNDPGYPSGGAGYGLGLTLSVPIYDGGLQGGAVKTAQALLKSARADLVTAQLQVKTDVSQAYLALKGAEEQDEAARLNVKNAQESLRIAEGRYKSGLGLFLDIINAQAELLTTQTNEANAQGEVYRQRATLEHAAGLLLP